MCTGMVASGSDCTARGGHGTDRVTVAIYFLACRPGPSSGSSCAPPSPAAAQAPFPSRARRRRRRSASRADSSRRTGPDPFPRSPSFMVLTASRRRSTPGRACSPTAATPSRAAMPNTARFDDAIGALRYLQSRPFVIPERVASFGWSQGGLYAMSVINGPTLERARARGGVLPPVGFAAAIAMYPGGCRDYAKELVVRPLLLIIAGSDDWTPPQYCREMAANVRARGADVTLVEYKGAYHYFDVVGQRKEVLKDIERPFTKGIYGVTVAYDAEAAADAQRQAEGL